LAYSTVGVHRNIKLQFYLGQVLNFDLTFISVDNSAFGKARKESETIGWPVY